MKEKKINEFLHVKMNPQMKEDLKSLSKKKGISMSAYIKLTLTEIIRKEKEKEK
jgi:antitoxin component of RelBE/YafQ-DinJ toxin-antitoxin module